MDFHFIATNAGSKDKKVKTNPERAIVRHEFMEALVRVAEDRYLRNPEEQCDNILEAMNRMFENLRIMYEREISDEKEWKEQNYWTQEVDTCLQQYRDFL